jgi:gliding motility-associated-like protein
VIKVVVNRGTSCSDSTFANVRVYPGFFPGFSDNTPVCKGNPVQFNDATIASYGNVNNWRWDFGDPTTTSDTSTQRNPAYAYTNSGTYNVRLIVGSDKGCLDTITKSVTIVEKPAISVTRDTLICDVDTIRLNVTAPAGGTIAWSPDYNISSLNSLNPLVSPDVTTTYYLVFTDSLNCVARDSVKVNVRSGVFVRTGNDTTICRTDAVTLSLNSDALYFEWTPAAGLSNPTDRNPQATPTDPITTYTVTAFISPKCFSTDNITIRTVPYPAANASGDTSLCFGFSTRLNASGGTSYSWTPNVFLSNPNIPNPVVQNPATGVRYIVAVSDTAGCPKPSFDTVFVEVIRVNANAGPRDTSVVIGQPLQLNATGGINYQWSPSNWLSNPNSASPVSLPQDDIEYVVMVTDGPGCTGYDTINVKLYRLQAGIELPSAFTPNGDGLNDIFKPILLGMRSLDLFRVYNRWGQLIFSTSEQNKGWDGSYRSNPQAAGTYVWIAEGVTYDNRKISKKGTVVLIR